MRKLTLSMDEEVIRDARRLADEQGTSISAMLSRIIRAMAGLAQPDPRGLPPQTRSALGMFSLPTGKTDRELLEEALLERHGPDR